MNKKAFEDWFMLIYRNDKHRNLKLDCDWQYFHGDRKELVFFLLSLYKMIEQVLGKKLNCSFMQSHDLLTKCDCELCKKLWKHFDDNHVELVCKNCGFHHWLNKNTHAYEHKDEHMEKFGKFNTYDYCFECSSRLEILEKQKKEKKNVIGKKR